jgi:hypothetical protein
VDSESPLARLWAQVQGTAIRPKEHQGKTAMPHEKPLPSASPTGPSPIPKK